MRFALLCSLLLHLSLPAQDVSCRQCASHGETECKQHKRGLLELEQGVVHCSVAAACRKCSGALTIDCKICTNVAVENAAEARRELAQAWIRARREDVDKHTRKKGVEHVKTAHADLTFSLKPMTVGKTKLDSHRLMHVYAQRLEELRALYIETFELAERDFPRAGQDVDPRLHVYMFQDVRDQRSVAPRVTGVGSAGVGAKLMGTNLVYSMYRDGRSMKDDEAVHRSVTHNVTHLLLSGTEPVMWIGNRSHGWIDEGLAHWFEYQVDGRCTNFCYEEVALQPGAGFKGGKWKVAMRKIAAANKLQKFTDLYQKNSDQLDFEAHAHAFAWVDFLITAQGGPKFMDMVRRVKKKEATRDAMRAVYGFGPLQFDEKFKAWVLETYPTR